MTTTTGASAADRQRQRASRGIGSSTGGRGSRLPQPPRQRRPAMAALAVLLIVGGALLAGLLAIRMDSRVPVLTVNREIPAGTRITAGDLEEIQVASDSDELVEASLAGQVVGLYTQTKILPGQFIDRRVLTNQDPLTDDGGRAIVSVLLNPALAPEAVLATGDKVSVVRASQETGRQGREITEALVIGKTRGSTDELGAGGSGSLTLLVPVEAVEAVIDAAANNQAGIALLSRGNSADDVSLSLAGE